MKRAKQQAHTPGPWVAVGCQVEVLSDSIPDICNTNPETFGQHGRSDKERCANARLIASAPDLLDALIYLRDCAESGAWPTGERWAQVQEVIKKVTGEPA